MISYRQTEANRRNALKSTGPRTEAGKLQSRRNAVRHGLMAETVIGSLEDASLIGRSGSSTFRLSTVAASMSLASSRFSSESAPRPFQYGIRR